MFLLLFIFGITTLAVWKIAHTTGNPWPIGGWASLLILTSVSLFLWGNRETIDRYRITLHGYRFSLLEADGRLRPDPIVFGGNRETVDVAVPGGGQSPIAMLRIIGTDSIEGLAIETLPDAGGLVRLGRDAAFLGSESLLPARRVQISGVAGTLTLIAEPRDRRGRWHRLMILQDDQIRARVDLPDPELKLPSRIRASIPWLRSGRTASWRTYPLADILDVGLEEEGSAFGGLKSFLYYSGKDLRVALLDSEVTLDQGPEGLAPRTQQFSTSIPANFSRLPLRDYLELELTQPERRGVRPLRNFSIERRGEWVDVLFSTNEERYALTLRELAVLDPAGRFSGDYQLRISPTRTGSERRALPFLLPSDRFIAVAPAVLRLPRDPAARSFTVVTPAGSATEQLGTIFPVGEIRDASLLIQVDRFALTRGFAIQWMFVVLLTVLAFFGMRGPRGEPYLDGSERYVAGGAVVLVALLSFRLLISLSASMKPPFFDNAWPLALAALPMAPWLLTRGALLGRNLRDWFRDRPVRNYTGFGELIGPVVAFGALGTILFESGLKIGVMLALLVVVTLAPIVVHTIKAPAFHRVKGFLRLEVWLTRHPIAVRIFFTTLAVAGGLFIFRAALFLLGVREALEVSGNRFSVSILYSPALIAGTVWLARLIVRHSRSPYDALWGWVALLAFVFLAIVVVGFMISDLGLILTATPSVLIVMAFTRYLLQPVEPMVGGRLGRALRRLYPIPLIAFIALQSNPWPLTLMSGISSSEEALMEAWSRDELLILDRLNPEFLQNIGQARSEAVAVQRATMEAYTRSGLRGSGFLQGSVSPEIRVTAVHEHTASVFVAGEWGLAGGLFLLCLHLLVFCAVLRLGFHRPGRTVRAGSLVLALFAVVAFGIWAAVLSDWLAWIVLGLAALPHVFLDRVYSQDAGQVGPERHRLASLDIGTWLAVTAVIYFVANNVFMLLGNYGLTLFTGKNIFFFGLDSMSDYLESFVIVAIIGIGFGSMSYRDPE